MSALSSAERQQDQSVSVGMGLRKGLADEEVSWVVGELDPKDLQGHLAPDFPWRELIYRELLQQNALSEAQDFLWCGSNFRAIKVCSADITHSKPIPISCHRRYCPQCARRAAAALAKAHTPQILDIIEKNTNKDYRLRSITLTTKIDLYSFDVVDQVKTATALVNQFFDLVGGQKLPEKYRNRWSEPNHQYFTGEGLLFSVEFGPLGNLLHFHCLWFGRWIGKYWLSKAWESLSGNKIAWIESVNETASAIQESLKYVSKLIKVKTDPDGEQIELFPDPKYIARLALVLRGSRRVFTRGVFRGLKAEIADPEEESGCKCDTCGSDAELVNMSSWQVVYYRKYLPAMQQLDLRPGNNSAETDETAQPPPKPQFGKLLTEQENERIAAIRRSEQKYDDDWFLK